jgi:hypothetical protein
MAAQDCIRRTGPQPIFARSLKPQISPPFPREVRHEERNDFAQEIRKDDFGRRT